MTAGGEQKRPCPDIPEGRLFEDHLNGLPIHDGYGGQDHLILEPKGSGGDAETPLKLADQAKNP